MRREQRERDRVVGLPRFVADEERRRGQQQDRRNRLNPGPPQDFGRDDLGRIDGGCRASRIAHHGRREPRRRALLRDDADRAHEPFVELRLALFDEPGNPRVGRSLAQRQTAPRPRRRRRRRPQGCPSAASANGARRCQRGEDVERQQRRPRRGAPRDVVARNATRRRHRTRTRSSRLAMG